MKYFGICCAILSSLLFVGSVTGCGGGGSSNPGPQNNGTPGTFTLSFNPPLVVVALGTSQSMQVHVTGQNGFSGQVNIAVTGLPSGVTVSPAPLTINANGSGTLTISASASAALGNVQMAIQGTSGTIAISGSATLAVAAKIATPASRPFITVGGGINAGFYDEGRQLLFATNSSLNEVDVISGVDLSLHARVPVPAPFGIDQMMDGKTLVIGTLTQGLYTLDEDTLVATPHLAPNFSAIKISTVVLPVPVALANGDVFAIGQEVGIFGGNMHLIQWDSNADVFSEVSLPGFTQLSTEVNNLKRSGDHKWAFFTANNLFLYSSDTDALTSIALPGNVADVAANPTGTQFASVSGQQITFYDNTLKVVGTSNLSVGFQDNLQYSEDGSRLYYEGSLESFLVDAINTTTFSDAGHVTSQYGLAQFAPQLLSVDGSQRAFLATLGGIGTVDASSLSTAAPTGMIPGQFNPPAIPLNNSSTPVTFGVPSPPAGFVVTFGGVPGVVQSFSPLTVLPPPSTVAGPVDVEFTLANGEAYLTPLGFSYGVDVVTPTANLIANSGNPTIGLFGFGITNGQLATPPTITVGGQPASNVQVDPQNAGAELQDLVFTLPNSGAGAADISLSNNIGSGTLKNSLTYISSTTVVPNTGLLQLLYDTHRNLIYGLKSSEIDVFNPTTLQFQNPLRPGNPTNPSYVSIAMTPDGTRMLVTDSQNATVTIFNPDNPATNTVVVVSTLPLQTPIQVVTTNTNKAFITMSGTVPRELDLGSLQLTQRTDSIFLLATKFAATPDGSHLAAATLNNSNGTVSVWDPTSDTFTSQNFVDGFWTDLAISNDGKIIVPVEGAPGLDGIIVAFFDDQLHYINAPEYPDLVFPDMPASLGVMFSPSGQSWLAPSGDAIDVFDPPSGTLRSRILTPAPIPQINFPLGSSGVLAIDPSGQTIYAISTSGLMVLRLPTPVDLLPRQVYPLSSRPSPAAALKAKLAAGVRARAAKASKTK